MARQPKTAPPKNKFGKIFKCHLCGRPTSEFFTQVINNVRHVVCKGGCRDQEGYQS